MDQYDRAIIEQMQLDGRLSYAELGERIGLSKTPCWKRVQKLEQDKVITAYRAEIDPDKVGLGLHVFLEITILHTRAAEFEAAVKQLDYVVECYAIAGENDYLVSVMAPDIDRFDRLLRGDFANLPGVQRLATTLCLRTIKNKSRIPVF